MKKFTFLLIISVFLTAGITAQSNGKIPLIGSEAPSFTEQSTNGKINFPDDFGSDWKILFSHPRDFTPVCTTELLELAYRQNEFEQLGVKLAVISTDDLEQHELWKTYLEETDYKNRGQQQISFPIIADLKAKVADKYGMLNEAANTTEYVRGVFIIDDKNIIRSVNFYPMEIGRNIDELIRIVEALKTTDEEDVLIPANWNKGDDVIMPYLPYTNDELVDNPELQNNFYNVGNRVWFKKVKN